MEQSKTTDVAFRQIFERLQEQLDLFEKNNAVLNEIGNKFIDDSGDLIKGEEKKDVGRSGLIKELNYSLDRMKNLNNFYYAQIVKLQTIV
jgi:hypothetical protein